VGDEESSDSGVSDINTAVNITEYDSCLRIGHSCLDSKQIDGKLLEFH